MTAASKPTIPGAVRAAGGQTTAPASTHTSGAVPTAHSGAEGLAPLGPDAAARAVVTLRQRQVLAGVAYGLVNEQIAERMGITVETVRSHVRGMLASLGAVNRAHAVALGFRFGLLRGVRPEPCRGAAVADRGEAP